MTAARSRQQRGGTLGTGLTLKGKFSGCHRPLHQCECHPVVAAPHWEQLPTNTFFQPPPKEIVQPPGPPARTRKAPQPTRSHHIRKPLQYQQPDNSKPSAGVFLPPQLQRGGATLSALCEEDRLKLATLVTQLAIAEDQKAQLENEVEQVRDGLDACKDELAKTEAEKLDVVKKNRSIAKRLQKAEELLRQYEVQIDHTRAEVIGLQKPSASGESSDRSASHLELEVLQKLHGEVAKLTRMLTEAPNATTATQHVFKGPATAEGPVQRFNVTSAHNARREHDTEQRDSGLGSMPLNSSGSLSTCSLVETNITVGDDRPSNASMNSHSQTEPWIPHPSIATVANAKPPRPHGKVRKERSLTGNRASERTREANENTRPIPQPQKVPTQEKAAVDMAEALERFLSAQAAPSSSVRFEPSAETKSHNAADSAAHRRSSGKSNEPELSRMPHQKSHHPTHSHNHPTRVVIKVTDRATSPIPFTTSRTTYAPPPRLSEDVHARDIPSNQSSAYLSTSSSPAEFVRISIPLQNDSSTSMAPSSISHSQSLQISQDASLSQSQSLQISRDTSYYASGYSSNVGADGYTTRSPDPPPRPESPPQRWRPGTFDHQMNAPRSTSVPHINPRQAPPAAPHGSSGQRNAPAFAPIPHPQSTAPQPASFSQSWPHYPHTYIRSNVDPPAPKVSTICPLCSPNQRSNSTHPVPVCPLCPPQPRTLSQATQISPQRTDLRAAPAQQAAQPDAYQTQTRTQPTVSFMQSDQAQTPPVSTQQAPQFSPHPPPPPQQQTTHSPPVPYPANPPAPPFSRPLSAPANQPDASLLFPNDTSMIKSLVDVLSDIEANSTDTSHHSDKSAERKGKKTGRRRVAKVAGSGSGGNCGPRGGEGGGGVIEGHRAVEGEFEDELWDVISSLNGLA
ncbi:uncharacterized protein EV422DRAFT_538733 [Fimicolochytrium jonesii]|uniref:uncharacterized protein n=1 Tax=Fimicolochytrium jonesii TaxID=1396493 RepID=UPI0022FE8FA8|nr:uncharacterized protein EV422DRAFT_538733 [Fimicolochytrium jonesii]KAI8818099.1 hypothetical protein EV422DRAFT_538733 [Fimicolochytrium jonesii]